MLKLIWFIRPIVTLEGWSEAGKRTRFEAAKSALAERTSKAAKSALAERASKAAKSALAERASKTAKRTLAIPTVRVEEIADQARDKIRLAWLETNLTDVL